MIPAGHIGAIAASFSNEPVYVEMIFDDAGNIDGVIGGDKFEIVDWLNFFYPGELYLAGEEPFTSVIADNEKITLTPNANNGYWNQELRKDIFGGNTNIISFIDTGYFTSIQP